MTGLPSKIPQLTYGATTWLLLALLFGGLAYGWIAAWAGNSSGFSDAIDYLFMADFYHEWLQGEPSKAAIEHYRSTRFPPAFPFLLALAGGGSANISQAILVSCIIAITTAACFGIWARAELRENKLTAWMALMLLWYPAYFLLNLNVVSEPMAMLMLCLIFILAGLHASPSITLTIALLIGLSPLVRTATLPLLPAFAIWLGWRRQITLGWKILAVVISTVPFLLWSMYRRALGADSYTDSLRPARILETMGGWPDALWVLPQRFFSGLAGNWESAQSAFAFAATLLLMMAFAGLVLRLRRNALDAWFLIGYIVMIMIWPYPDETSRFLVVVYPILLLHAVVAANWLDGRMHARWRTPRHLILKILVLSITLASAAAMLRFADRAAVPMDAALLSDKRESYFFRAKTDAGAQAAAEVVGRARLLAAESARVVPEPACIYTDFPQFVALYSGRHAVPFPAKLGDPERAQRLLRKCDYFLLAGFSGAQTRRGKLYPHRALQGWTRPVLISTMLHAGKVNTAAVLLERKSATPAVDPTPVDWP